MAKYLLALFGAAVIVIIWLANTIPGIFSFVQVVPFGDKILHFLILGTLTFLACWARHGGSKRQQLHASQARPIWPIPLLIGVIITIEEFSQIFIPARAFDLGDLFANMSGIVAGWTLFYCCRVLLIPALQPESR